MDNLIDIKIDVAGWTSIKVKVNGPDRGRSGRLSLIVAEKYPSLYVSITKGKYA